ncbi:MAG: BrnT family toxin [Rhodospirillales bacterium]|nr:MAG: BrnT family toxin [Rhodospirillales bacterium]
MLTWDEVKRARNIAKHGVDLADAEGFDFAKAIVAIDDRADYGEVREVAVGFIGERLHVLVFTRRGGDIHVISLRKANRRECSRYETET